MDTPLRGGPLTVALSVERFLLVTYACPVARAQAVLPRRLRVHPWMGPDGGPVALFSASCFLSRDVRPSLTGWPRITYYQSTFRVYCTDPRTGQVGAYFLATYVQRGLGFWVQRAIAHHVKSADFDVDSEVRDDGWSLAMEATTGGEILRLEAAGPAEEAEPEAAYFITHRLNGWTRLALWPLGNMPVRHPRMSPYTGTLTDVRIDRFRTLGLLTGEEEQRPFAVHFTPQVPFIGLPPVPLF